MNSRTITRLGLAGAIVLVGGAATFSAVTTDPQPPTPIVAGWGDQWICYDGKNYHFDDEDSYYAFLDKHKAHGATEGKNSCKVTPTTIVVVTTTIPTPTTKVTTPPTTATPTTMTATTLPAPTTAPGTTTPAPVPTTAVPDTQVPAQRIPATTVQAELPRPTAPPAGLPATR